MRERYFSEIQQSEHVGNFKTFGIPTSIGKGETKDGEVVEVTERPGMSGDRESTEKRVRGVM